MMARSVLTCLGLTLCTFALGACTTTDGGNQLQASLASGQNPDTDTVLASVSGLDPSLPDIGPIPGSREQLISEVAFAGTVQSPTALATGMAFETPADAPGDLDGLIGKYASVYEVPERLVRRVVHRESRFNPAARNGPYWGLMQIRHDTARGMGYAGGASGLLDAETNLKYAVKYLAGAYKVADGDESQAVRYYARGYYYDAKRKGLLVETGLKAGPPKAKSETIETVTSAEEAALTKRF